MVIKRRKRKKGRNIQRGASPYGHFYPGIIVNVYRKDYDIEFDDYGEEWRPDVPLRYVRRPRKKGDVFEA